MNFRENWINLAERKELIDSNDATTEWLKCFPLDPEFIEWARANEKNVEIILRDNTFGKRQRPGSPQDIAHSLLKVRNSKAITASGNKVYHLKEMDKARSEKKNGETILITTENIIVKGSTTYNRYFTKKETRAERRAMQEAFPISVKIRDERMRPDMPQILEWIDKRIAEWNPRLKTVDPEMHVPALDYDEYGHDIAYQYVQASEIIGDMDNTQFIGIDENGDSIYRDFDPDGHFLPMGNSNNATDYQDDFDPQGYSPEQWQSIDRVDDHHIDNYYREQCVTERPEFDENGMIEWKTETHSDTSIPVNVSDDADFVTNARNWLTRENLIRVARNESLTEEIHKAYPVSRWFLDFIDENGIDWETANARLESLIETRDADDDDIETVEDLPTPVEVDPMEEINREINALGDEELYQPPAYGELELDTLGTHFSTI